MKYVAFLLFGALLGIGAMIYRDTSPVSPIPSTLSPSEHSLTPTPVTLSAQTVITRLENIRELAVLNSTVDTVTELQDTTEFITWKPGFDPLMKLIRYLNEKTGVHYIKMQGSGTFKTYIDLRELQRGVSIEGNKVIFSNVKFIVGDVTLNLDKTYPIAMQQEFLIGNDDYSIAQAGYAKVLEQITQKKCDFVVREQAKENAQTVLSDLVHMIDPEKSAVVADISGFNCDTTK